MGMKETYIKLLTFLLLLVGANYILHYSYKVIIYNKTDNARKEKQFEEYHGKLKYLFLGDSHSQNTIDPSLIPNSFNFSSANENYIQTYFKLKGIVNELGRKPEYVVLPVDLSSFSSFRTGRFFNASLLLTFADYLEISIYEKDFAYIQTWLENEFFMYAGNYTTISRFLRSRNDFSNMKLGFKGRTGNLLDQVDVREACEKKAKLYLDGYDPFDAILRDYFVRILDFCQKQDIKVYLMKMPLAKEYVEACNKYFSVDDYYQKIYALSSRYPSVKNIFDFQDYFFGQQHFLRNPDHANMEGAQVFSTMLAKELAKFENDEHPF
ncbi:MAG: hypothetical protein K9H64_12225 [Bacteroidales bacterium]|nr:hypothetical protein [Bacteroidales bacterium]MCF8456787.1 hypothetical protein [Bacteroidales bacterium]